MEMKKMRKNFMKKISLMFLMKIFLHIKTQKKMKKSSRKRLELGESCRITDLFL